MSDLSEPSATEDLYAYWGETPPASRPIMQGDVFSDLMLPGLGDEPLTAQVVMHPCQMRRGAQLRERISMVPVVEAPHKVSSKTWKRTIRFMPLPELRGAGSADYHADLSDPTPVLSGSLHLDKRVAALSDDGVLLLQQRLVMGSTRVFIELDRFHKQMAPTFVEMELQENWVEALLGDGAESPEQVIKDFHSWLDQGETSRRDRLVNPREHSRLRREVHEALKERRRS
jgi:hypothetical protein